MLPMLIGPRVFWHGLSLFGRGWGWHVLSSTLSRHTDSSCWSVCTELAVTSCWKVCLENSGWWSVQRCFLSKTCRVVHWGWGQPPQQLQDGTEWGAPCSAASCGVQSFQPGWSRFDFASLWICADYTVGQTEVEALSRKGTTLQPGVIYFDTEGQYYYGDAHSNIREVPPVLPGTLPQVPVPSVRPAASAGAPDQQAMESRFTMQEFMDMMHMCQSQLQASQQPMVAVPPPRAEATAPKTREAPSTVSQCTALPESSDSRRKSWNRRRRHRGRCSRKSRSPYDFESSSESSLTTVSDLRSMIGITDPLRLEVRDCGIGVSLESQGREEVS